MADSKDQNSNETPPSPVVGEIAKALTERRKLRGLTLDQVHQAIKIRVSYLKALEQGQWDELPGEVYIRGFIKRYAQYLGLDADKLLAPYVEEDLRLGERSEPQNAAEPKTMDQYKLVGIWIGIAVFIGIGLMKLATIRKPADPPSAPAVSLSSAPAVSSPAAPILSNKKEDNSHLLEVYSPYPLWLRVESKDRSFEGFIPQGATWSWKGEGEILVRLGHTRQVSLFFDGSLIPVTERQKRIRLPQQPAPH